ncbi:MAG TPA: VOC family protein [Chryseolinea sp.]
MKIDHVALWTFDLERARIFYEKYFDAKSGAKYFNPKKDFESYFLSFKDGCRLEIMQMPGIIPLDRQGKQHSGLIHFAISVGDKATVETLTEKLRADGYEIAGEPRLTGDGYYESVVLDPDGNLIEITI